MTTNGAHIMCTAITLKSTENHFFFGRTQEFNLLLDYNVAVIPRKFHISHAFTPYEGRYGGLGMICEGLPHFIDGINEHGLAGATLYFANENRYISAEEIKKQGKIALRGEELITFVLLNYRSIDEIIDNINHDVAICDDNTDSSFGSSLPQHYIFIDKTGECLVVEPSIPGEFKLFKNPIGVMTNNPTFDWHLTNLQNYVGLHDAVDGDKTLPDFLIKSAGKGSGLRGLPGDFTPASRFIRATFLKCFSDKVNDVKTLDLLFHILDTSDIPKGVIRCSSEHDLQYTQYTSAYDIQKQHIFVHTYDNRRIQTVKWNETLLDKPEMTLFQIDNKQDIAVMKAK